MTGNDLGSGELAGPQSVGFGVNVPGDGLSSAGAGSVATDPSAPYENGPTDGEEPIVRITADRREDKNPFFC